MLSIPHHYASTCITVVVLSMHSIVLHRYYNRNATLCRDIPPKKTDNRGPSPSCISRIQVEREKLRGNAEEGKAQLETK